MYDTTNKVIETSLFTYQFGDTNLL